MSNVARCSRPFWLLCGLSLFVSIEGRDVPEMCRHPTVVFTVSCQVSGSVSQQIGLNTTFPLVDVTDGSPNGSYPWVDVRQMNHEVTFLEQQVSPLVGRFSERTQATRITGEYACSLSPFGCAFVCTARMTDGELVVLNRTEKLAHGTGFETLKRVATSIEQRWSGLCVKVAALDTVANVSTLFAQISSPSRILCTAETRTPVLYTLALSGRGLETVSANATRSRDGGIVRVSVENSTVPGYTLADLNCSLSSPFGWTVSVEERTIVAESQTETGVHVVVPVLVLLAVFLSCLLLARFRQRLGLRRLDEILEDVRLNLQYRLTGRSDL